MRKAKKNPIRVIVVDDSPTVRELLVALLQGTEGIQVVGTGSDGEEAVKLAKRMHPDVITMDVRMPIMDGLEATRQIMREVPTPIIIVTGSLMRADVDLSFEALRAGALTIVRTPGLNDSAACDKVIQAVRLMAEVPVVRRWAPDKRRPALLVPVAPVAPIDIDNQRVQVIGIASSTGGPGALAKVLGPLPADFPSPILVVQHVTKGFGVGLAEWLNGETPLAVRVAEHGERLQPGAVLLAPDDYHLQVSIRGVVELSKEPPLKGLRPSANYLFRSLAQAYGSRAVGIILTGMGDDGVEGLVALHRAGGLTVAQDEASCVVYGMPREAIMRHAADQILSLDQIATALDQLAHQQKADADG